jgi:DnaJ-class molecular chaperone
MRDPYAVLGIAKTADAAEIKSAFRKAAKKHHPDQNPGDTKAQARFAEVNQAYEILGDAAKRREFDQGMIGPDGKPRFAGGQGFGNGGNTGGGFSGNPFEGFGGFAGGFGNAGAGGNARERRRSSQADDILSELFGGGFGPSTERRKASKGFTPPAGNDVNIFRDVSIEELAAGSAEIDLPTGARVAVNLPKGVFDGQVIRLKGKGYSSPTGGAPGDANVTIRFKQDWKRRVDGTTLTLDVALPFDVAVLGGKLPVETPLGRIALTIHPMTDGDRVFRLKERGLEAKDGSRGDLLVTVRLMLPKNDPDGLTKLAERIRATVDAKG